MSDLSAILDDALAQGRALRESVRLTSRVTVRRKTGRQAQSETTGEQLPVWSLVASEVPFRLGTGGSDGGSRTVVVGGVAFEEASAVGEFPAAFDELADGDFLEVTSGEWSGAVFSVVAAVRADQKTARRVPVREESRPDEWGS